MSRSEIPNGKQSRKVLVPRWFAFLLGLPVALVVYPFFVVVVPWAISLATPRGGWDEAGPAAWNVFGLIPVLVGLAGLIWVFTVLFSTLSQLPEMVQLEETSTVLLTSGPYALSRNPMFLFGLTAWLGWALYYGSVVILIISVVLWAGTNSFTVPREERALERRFGETYRDYKRKVPRWLGRTQRR